MLLKWFFHPGPVIGKIILMNSDFYCSLIKRLAILAVILRVARNVYGFFTSGKVFKFQLWAIREY
jgi:hypothetical protein